MSKSTVAKRLPSLKFHSRPPSLAYRELIAMLADSAQRVEDGADLLAEVSYSVRAITVFLRRDVAARSAILPGPLSHLQGALHDLEQGGDPPLFARRALNGRPTNTVSQDLVKAWVAAAYDHLLQAKIDKNEAAKWVEQKCRSLGIWQSKGEITAKRIARWHRDLVSEQLAAKQAVAGFKLYCKSNIAITNPWERALIGLETYAGFMMVPKMPKTPRFSRSDEDASS